MKGVLKVRITIILTLCLLTLTAGCENAGSKSPVLEELSALKQEKKQLTRQIEQFEAENQQLKQRLHVLSGLPEQVKAENLYSLRTVKIGGYTNLYDKDTDGRKEKLIVYIQPMDEDGDIIKATGAVDVELWDLNREDGQALLGQWLVKPEELKKLWFATLITINYRLTFDIAGKIDTFDRPLTVKTTFTDYLSGKVFKEQKVIKPQ